jgi:hypothetical protein
MLIRVRYEQDLKINYKQKMHGITAKNQQCSKYPTFNESEY